MIDTFIAAIVFVVLATTTAIYFIVMRGISATFDRERREAGGEEGERGE